MSLLDPKDLEIPSLITVSNRIAFRTSTCLDKKANSKFFYIAQFDLKTSQFEVKRIANPLNAKDVEYLEANGIEGFSVSEAPREIKKQDDFFTRYASAAAQSNFTSMAHAFLELDDYMCIPKDSSKQFVALPDAYIAQEKELLGAFHIRKYLIEHGSLAGRPNPATRKSDIHMLSDLARNAFNPLILTDIIPEEWHYASRRVNSMTPPAPIFIHTPFDALPLSGIEDWKDNEPTIPMRIDVKQIMSEIEMKASNSRALIALESENAPENAAPEKSRLSRSQQKWIMTALLTEPGDISVTAPKWLELLKKDHDFVLTPADLKDRNGPLGVLFYQAVSGGKIKYGFEALPALLNHFNHYGYAVSMRDIDNTKIRGASLMEHMRAAREDGINAPFDVVNSPLTRGLRP